MGSSLVELEVCFRRTVPVEAFHFIVQAKALFLEKNAYEKIQLLGSWAGLGKRYS